MVKRFVILVLALYSQFAVGQVVTVIAEEQAYTKAIAAYLKASSKRNAYVLDTLIVGKRPDLFVAKLPPKVGSTTILFLTTKETEEKRQYNKKLVFVNLVSTITREDANFLFVTFYPGYKHQYDCMIDLRYSNVSHTFELEQLSLKDYAYR